MVNLVFDVAQSGIMRAHSYSCPHRSREVALEAIEQAIEPVSLSYVDGCLLVHLPEASL